MFRRGLKLLSILLIAGLLADIVVDSLDECQWAEQDNCATATCHVGSCQSHQGVVYQVATLIPVQHQTLVGSEISLHVPSGSSRQFFHPPKLAA